MNKKEFKNQVIFQKGINFGTPDAENDALLSDCFVNLEEYNQIVDMESPKTILLGRTGSGKSALLVQKEKRSSKAVRIEPRELSFSYLSNSNIISYVSELGCDLNVLYSYLWKHIILCKVVGLYFDNRNKLDFTLDSLSKRNHPTFEYFNKYKDTFWINHDEVINEVSEKFETSLHNKLEAVLGESFASIKAGVGAELKLSNNQKKLITSRVKKAISEIQINSLANAISGLNEVLRNKTNDYYLLLDDLDLDWTETDIKYQMIRSLVDCLKSFRKIRNVKIIVALRSDVYERSILSNRGDGFQPEKYEGIYSEIDWKYLDLKKLVDDRISEVFKRKYTQTNVKFSDVFPSHMRKTGTLKYLIERTQYRPRDIIAFLNIIFESASGQTNITEKIISAAETEYSKKRYDALRREWEILHPHLGVYMDFLQNKSGKVKFEELATKDIIENLALKINDERENFSLIQKELPIDDVERECDLYFKRGAFQKINVIAKNLLVILYKTGVIEIKLGVKDIYRTAYTNEPTVVSTQISNDTVFQVAPMLWRALGITPNL